VLLFWIHAPAGGCWVLGAGIDLRARDMRPSWSKREKQCVPMPSKPSGACMAQGDCKASEGCTAHVAPDLNPWCTEELLEPQ